MTISALHPHTHRLARPRFQHPAELFPAPSPCPPTPTLGRAHQKEKLGSQRWNQAGSFKSAVFSQTWPAVGGDCDMRHKPTSPDTGRPGRVSGSLRSRWGNPFFPPTPPPEAALASGTKGRMGPWEVMWTLAPPPPVPLSFYRQTQLRIKARTLLSSSLRVKLPAFLSQGGAKSTVL